MSNDEQMLVVHVGKHSLRRQHLIQHQILAIKHADLGAQMFALLRVGISATKDPNYFQFLLSLLITRSYPLL